MANSAQSAVNSFVPGSEMEIEGLYPPEFTKDHLTFDFKDGKIGFNFPPRQKSDGEGEGRVSHPRMADN